MTRAELELVIRVAADIADDKEIVVIGSQSILGQFPDAPASLRASVEADVFPKNRPERADLMIAKAIAGRERDHEFVREVIRHGLVDCATVLERIERVPVDQPTRDRVRTALKTMFWTIGPVLPRPGRSLR